MQTRDVMTRAVVVVGAHTTLRHAAEVMADRGFAALPVVDEDLRLVGIVAEADLLRSRIHEDPRLHALRDDPGTPPTPSRVDEVMTRDVRAVDVTADVGDVARLFVDAGLRSVPVTDGGRLVGIVSRRDLLRLLIRSDDHAREELLRLVEGYTGDVDAWDVAVRDGAATIRRLRGEPQGSEEVEWRTLTALARTVGGITAVRVLAAPRATAGTGPDRPLSAPVPRSGP
ncbi:CBS domain-containing protein [Geodermatophilus sp. SYSU D00766]